MKRELKYYTWIFHEGSVTLIDKKANNVMALKMLTLDSLVRAYISFKNRQKIDEKNTLRERFASQKEKLILKIEKLKGGEK